MSSRAALTPLGGLDSSSRRTSSSLRPSTPPFALISSIAMVRPRVIASPDWADGPLSAATRPILIGSAACARPAAAASSAAMMVFSIGKFLLVGDEDIDRRRCFVHASGQQARRLPTVEPMQRRAAVKPNLYKDSVALMRIGQRLQGLAGVRRAT